MKLFYLPAASSLSVHIVLRELGLSFDLERVDRTTKRTASGEDFMVLNPKGYVPALQLDDGEVLTEGPAITQFLADKFAPGLLAPLSGTIERARLNAQLTFIGTELHKPFDVLFDRTLALNTRSAIIAKLSRKFAFVEETLATRGPSFTGPAFTLPDAYLFVVQNWAPMVGIDLTPFPHIVALAARVAARPTVQAAMAAEQADAG